MLLIAVLAGISFLRLESKVTQAMLNLSLFRNMTFSFANLSALLNFMSQYVMVFLTPFYLQRVLHYSPDNLGLIMASFPLAVMVVAPFSASLSDRIGTRVPACSGAATCALSLFFMSTLPASASSSVKRQRGQIERRGEPYQGFETVQRNVVCAWHGSRWIKETARSALWLDISSHPAKIGPLDKAKPSVRVAAVGFQVPASKQTARRDFHYGS